MTHRRWDQGWWMLAAASVLLLLLAACGPDLPVGPIACWGGPSGTLGDSVAITTQVCVGPS